MPQVPREKRTLTRWLAQAGPLVLTPYAMALGFAVYFCMYAYRKPFTVATFPGIAPGWQDLTWKTLFVQSQLVGYICSKFLGMKFCAELTRPWRLAAMAGLISAAELALVLFALLPPDYKFLAMFLNGLPLGMIWGLVVLYLEGRQNSEVLLAALSTSYIVSSGWVKVAGAVAMSPSGGEFSEFWMPAVVGLWFFPLFVICAWLLDQLPEPTAADIAQRAARQPMNRDNRWGFLREFFSALGPLLLFFVLLTATRDFRDVFAVEIFTALGYGKTPAIFGGTETVVGLVVIICLGGLCLVRDNRWALLTALGMMLASALLVGGSGWLYQRGAISGLAWMITAGIGIYIAYVPFGSMLFDRLIAWTRYPGTAVYAIYVADFVGYCGSSGAQIIKDRYFSRVSHLEYCLTLGYLVAGTGVLGIGAGAWFLSRRQESAPASRNTEFQAV
ncbi:MAG: DUF5690 family protein [Pirellulales bacterium]|nr:DUF5690 family protein [Pirellulales bacterium]